MDPLTMGLGALGGGALGLLGVNMTNQANAAQAGNEMNFQAQMSDTAYQRQVADMKAAGLNPMFAMGSGGASSPGGAMATMQNPVQGMMSGASQAQSALNSQRTTDADILLKAAQTTQSNATTKNLGIDSKEKSAVGNIADAVSGVTDSVKQGYQGLRGLMKQGINNYMQSTAPKSVQKKTDSDDQYNSRFDDFQDKINLNAP